ncbi:MAG: hypothetical protein ACJ75B_06645 [Flavisolibacter sp.]
MAKDPAFLFYPNDWIGGTMGMTFEEKGAYMELLMMQFNRGHMTTHMIGQTVGQLWDKIKDKFIQDSSGFWYNQRLEFEQEKRKTFTESRRNNINGHNQHTKKEPQKRGHMTSHMENENENENIEGNRGTGEKGDQKPGNADPGAFLVPRMLTVWRKIMPRYILRRETDMPALQSIALSLVDYLQKPRDFADPETCNPIIELWEQLSAHINSHSHYSAYNLPQVFKFLQGILQSFTRPLEPAKTDIQHLYERYCEEGKIDFKLITATHFADLEKKGLVKIDNGLLQQITSTRLKNLEMPKDLAERELHDAYKAGNPDHPLIQQDRAKIELNAKRTVVRDYFKSLKDRKVRSVLASTL